MPVVNGKYLQPWRAKGSPVAATTDEAAPKRRRRTKVELDAIEDAKAAAKAELEAAEADAEDLSELGKTDVVEPSE